MLITEIGGTTGDIEGLPFLEAIREFALNVGYNNALFLHVTYVPFIKAPVITNMSWFTVLFFAIVITGASNAVNLTDGLDGLAIGCTITVAL